MPNPPSSLKGDRRTANLPPDEPEVTGSGVVPGRALLDTPSPGNEAPVLDRSQRARKASARKLASLESQAAESAQKRAVKRRARRARAFRSPTPTDDEIDIDDVGEASNILSSQPPANSGPTASDPRMAAASQSGGGAIAFFSKDEVVHDLSRWVGNVSHLSTQQLEKLLNSIPEPSDKATQASALGDVERRVAAIVQPPSPLALGGGYHRDRLESAAVASLSHHL